MPSSLVRLGAPEGNPFRPTLTDTIVSENPALREFLREQTESLRLSHNLTQAGDSTFSWELLTELQDSKEYTLGSIGRFWHPIYGIIVARYVQFGIVEDTGWLGNPYGVERPSRNSTDQNSSAWRVTNRFDLSQKDWVLGVGASYTLPKTGQFGWIIVNGVNLHSLRLASKDLPKVFDKFTWNQTASVEKQGEGNIFGGLVGDGPFELLSQDTSQELVRMVGPEARQGTEILQRFDPLFWTVNFPSSMVASLTNESATLIGTFEFHFYDHLAGVIWESEDQWDHPTTRYDTNKDYRNCQLGFTMQVEGDIHDLPDVNGSVLTIEGRDELGTPTIWLVRLANYIVSTGSTGHNIFIDFNEVKGGFGADIPIFMGDIDRMFIAVSPIGYDASRPGEPLPTVARGRVLLRSIKATGPNNYLVAGTGPGIPHSVRMTNGYDDTCNLNPARVVRNCRLLGYTDWFNHYVGMSHYMQWQWNVGEARLIAQDVELPLNPACVAWHTALARELRFSGFRFIMSLSFEMINSVAPLAWRQYDSNGNPALTGWSPPSTLLSPCNPAPMAYLQRVARQFAGIAASQGLPIYFQVGEPWWWIHFDTKIPCFYDPFTVAAYTTYSGSPPPVITSMLGAKTPTEILFLDWLGNKLAEGTRGIMTAVRGAHPDMTSLILIYLPQTVDDTMPDAVRVNMPTAWAYPEFDIMQLEDYDFVIDGDFEMVHEGRRVAEQRFRQPREFQHYFAGFVLDPALEFGVWENIGKAIQIAYSYNIPEVFVWAYTQVMRDGFVPLLSAATSRLLYEIPPGFAFLNHEGGSSQNVIAALAPQFSSITQSFTDLRTDILNLKAVDLTLKTSVGVVEAATSSLDLRLTNESFQRIAADTALQNRIEILEQSATLAGIDFRLASLEDSAGAFGLRLDQANLAIDIQARATDGLQVSITSLAETTNQSFSTMNLNLALAFSNIGTLQFNLDAALSNIQTMELNLNSAMSNIQTMESNFNSAISNIETMEVNLDSVISDVQAMDLDISSAFAEISNLNLDLDSVVSDVENMNVNVDLAFSNIETLNLDLELTVSEVETLSLNVDLARSAAEPPTENYPTLLAGWTTGDYPAEKRISYSKQPNGLVMLSGVMRNGTDGVVFTLPPGFRPGGSITFAAYAGFGVCKVVINSLGEVNLTNSAPSLTSLSGISFFGS